ncbi:MAG: hypothetical protein RLZZ184_4275, partial [Cyanobacteriota bacterium]
MSIIELFYLSLFAEYDNQRNYKQGGLSPHQFN